MNLMNALSFLTISIPTKVLIGVTGIFIIITLFLLIKYKLQNKKFPNWRLILFIYMFIFGVFYIADSVFYRFDYEIGIIDGDNLSSIMNTILGILFITQSAIYFKDYRKKKKA